MSLGHGQLDMLYGDEELVQVRISFWHEIEKPCIQTAGSYRVQLFQTCNGLKLQFRFQLALSESPEGIRNNPVPGRVLGEADAQRP
jgi:hypothetical protein